MWLLTVVYSDVWFQSIHLWKRLRTYVARIRLYTCMCQYVMFEVRFTGEGFTAIAACVWFFTRVCWHVTVQCCELSEGSVTDRTFVWLFTVVCAHVHHQVRLLTERFLTLRARERFFPCVNTEVTTAAMARVREDFATYAARVLTGAVLLLRKIERWSSEIRIVFFRGRIMRFQTSFFFSITTVLLRSFTTISEILKLS